MKKAIPAFALGILAPILVALVFVKLGGMPVPTKGNPLPLERWLARTALHAAMGREVDRPAPITADPGAFQAGAKLYAVHCAVCHGYPGSITTAIAKGMFPHPPELLPPKKGVTDDPVGETYWKVKNGIRLTGMPGFEQSLSENELWQVSLFLLHAKDLPPGVLTLVQPPK